MTIKSKKHKQVTTVINYKAVFTTEDGKKVLWDLMKASGFLDASYTNCSIAMAHSEGRRSIVLDIMKKLNVDVMQLQELMEKNIEKDQQYI